MTGCRKTIIALVTLFVATACSAQDGVASVYNGGRTASGEFARPSGFTAASRTLPLGSTAKVTNLRTHKSVTVRINDRGPYIRGRIIDLMPAAARAIGIDGLGKVRVTSTK